MHQARNDHSLFCFLSFPLVHLYCRKNKKPILYEFVFVWMAMVLWQSMLSHDIPFSRNVIFRHNIACVLLPGWPLHSHAMSVICNFVGGKCQKEKERERERKDRAISMLGPRFFRRKNFHSELYRVSSSSKVLATIETAVCGSGKRESDGSIWAGSHESLNRCFTMAFCFVCFIEQRADIRVNLALLQSARSRGGYDVLFRFLSLSLSLSLVLLSLVHTCIDM